MRRVFVLEMCRETSLDDNFVHTRISFLVVWDVFGDTADMARIAYIVTNRSSERTAVNR